MTTRYRRRITGLARRRRLAPWSGSGRNPGSAGAESVTPPRVHMSSTQWETISQDGRIWIVPVEDLREHVEDTFCPCLPRMVEGVLIHNSYDRREVGEVCRKALYLLGCVLADKGHTWTDEQREAFEHANVVLDMHWPV